GVRMVGGDGAPDEQRRSQQQQRSRTGGEGRSERLHGPATVVESPSRSLDGTGVAPRSPPASDVRASPDRRASLDELRRRRSLPPWRRKPDRGVGPSHRTRRMPAHSTAHWIPGGWPELPRRGGAGLGAPACPEYRQVPAVRREANGPFIDEVTKRLTS